MILPGEHPFELRAWPCEVVMIMDGGSGRLCTPGRDVLMWCSGKFTTSGMNKDLHMLRRRMAWSFRAQHEVGVLFYWECYDLVMMSEHSRGRIFEFGIAKGVHENYGALHDSVSVAELALDPGVHPLVRKEVPCEVVVVAGGDGEADLLCTPVDDVLEWASGLDRAACLKAFPGRRFGPYGPFRQLLERREGYSERHGKVVPVVSFWESHDLVLLISLGLRQKTCVGVARAVFKNYAALLPAAMAPWSVSNSEAAAGAV